MKQKYGKPCLYCSCSSDGSGLGRLPARSRDGVENYAALLCVGMTLGSMVIVLMSFSLFLSTRPRMGGTLLRRAGQDVHDPSPHIHKCVPADVRAFADRSHLIS
jgi:hypothetical protein